MVVNSYTYLCWLDCGLVSKYQLYFPMLVCLKEENQLKSVCMYVSMCVCWREEYLQQIMATGV